MNKNRFKQGPLFDIFFVWIDEFKAILKDPGLLLLLVVAPLAYPILYGVVYNNEVLREIPIAVVDQSGSEWSRKYIRSIDAVADVSVAERCISMDEAIDLYKNRRVHGILLIPADFQKNIYGNRQARVSVYTDMSSFLYYKAFMSASNFASRDLGLEIQMERLMNEGKTEREASAIAQPFTYSYKPLYNPTSGYASFLLPVVFILIIFQTLVLGIGMRSGTSYERNPEIYLNRTKRHRQSVFGLLTGKSLCYLTLYGILAFYILVWVPRWFNLPQNADIKTLFLFVLPFLMATVFFALTVSVFIYKRENAMAIFLFSSVILIFISGIPWPANAIPWYWKAIGWLLPSTHGAQGYVKINTMSAPLSAVTYEYLSLWILAGFYFMTAYVARLIQLNRIKKQVKKATIL